jgi:hypothetical protein
MLTFRRAYFLGLFVPGLLATTANANGINPPRPNGAKTVEATCTDRTTGNNSTVQRARVTVKNPTGSLEVRIEKSAPQIFQLSQIGRIQIATGTPNADGFAKASFELIGSRDKHDGYVRLSARGQVVRLTGFSAVGGRVDIPLANCSEVTLRALASSDAEGRTKKPVTAN